MEGFGAYGGVGCGAGVRLSDSAVCLIVRCVSGVEGLGCSPLRNTETGLGMSWVRRKKWLRFGPECFVAYLFPFRIPTIIPIEGRGFINQGSGLKLRCCGSRKG